MKTFIIAVALLLVGGTAFAEGESLSLYCGGAFSTQFEDEEPNDIYKIPFSDIEKMSARKLSRLNHVMIVFVSATQSSYSRGAVPKSLCANLIDKKYLVKKP